MVGFATTVAASPIDVVKTRYMNSPKGQYSGALDCAFRMYRQEGANAFYKGYELNIKLFYYFFKSFLLMKNN